MLIDEFLPEYHFSKKHSVVIYADAEKIFNILKETKFNSLFIRVLVMLRGIKLENISLTLSEKSYFKLLGEDKGKEILFGIIGKFWKWKGGLFQINKEEYKDFSLTGFAKAVWGFSAVPIDADKTTFLTETRVHCIGDAAKRWFSIYWFCIEPFSAVIRKIILYRIKYRAER
ncbi:MAG: hypothetical protein P8Z35_01855 [Ignavibacteriaceae bacterium]|jgi:hypothetical protein